MTLPAVAALLTACAGGPQALPPPRPLIVHSGVRLNADPDRMAEVNRWFTAERQNIEEDPSFLIEGVPVAETSFPWETLIIAGDTARIQVSRANPDMVWPYQVYAHMHLMKVKGRLEEWLPEAPDAEGYELERAILSRVSDTWLLGRAIFDTAPFPPLDQLVYAKENDFLDAFLLHARADEFAEEKAAWERENPGRMEAYRAWFEQTFETEPPGGA